MILTLLKNYPDLVGAKQLVVGYGNGPAAYAVTGDPVSIPRMTIDLLFGGVLSVSGNYSVLAQPTFGGNATTWNLNWFTAGGAEVGAGTNLSAEVVQVGGIAIAS